MANFDKMPGPTPEMVAKKARQEAKTARNSLRRTSSEFLELAIELSQANELIVDIGKRLATRCDRMSRDLERAFVPYGGDDE